MSRSWYFLCVMPMISRIVFRLIYERNCLLHYIDHLHLTNIQNHSSVTDLDKHTSLCNTGLIYVYTQNQNSLNIIFMISFANMNFHQYFLSEDECTLVPLINLIREAIWTITMNPAACVARQITRWFDEYTACGGSGVKMPLGVPKYQGCWFGQYWYIQWGPLKVFGLI